MCIQIHNVASFKAFGSLPVTRTCRYTQCSAISSSSTPHAARLGYFSSPAAPFTAAASANTPPPQFRTTGVVTKAQQHPSDIDISSLLDDIDFPDIDADLASFQDEDGAVFGDEGVPVSYGNDGYALEAYEVGVALIDRSHWGRLRLAGPHRLQFLHSQSTADVATLDPGSGTDTVLVTPQGRTIDVATVLSQGSGALLLLSPGMSTAIKERLEKFIFPNDEVSVSDIAPATAMFSLLGPASDVVMRELAAESVVGAEQGSHSVFSFGGKPVIAVVGGGLPGTGYTLIVAESAAGDLWRAITGRGAEPMGTRAWEIARVLAGRPAPGRELTEEYNPLEAGLYGAVSLNKGCYIGQETLAKVHSQGALRRELWGLELEAPCAVGADVYAYSSDSSGSSGKSIGRVTSYVDTVQQAHRALAYLKCRDGAQKVALEGKSVVVDGVKGKVVRIAAARRKFPEGAAPVEGAASKRSTAASEAAAAEEAARKAAKLKAMQDQLAAWQAAQSGGGQSG